MRRIKMVLAALVVTVAALAAFAGPAMAQSISVGNVGTGFTTLNNIGTGFTTLNSTLNGTLNGTFLGLNGNVLGPGFVGGGGTVVF